MAIGMMPPNLFCRAISLPLKRIGLTKDGHLPCIIKLMNVVNAEIRAGPVVLLDVHHANAEGEHHLGYQRIRLGKNGISSYIFYSELNSGKIARF